MDQLEILRNSIDELDDRLLPLFEARMHLAAEVAAYKREHALPVLQAGREQQVVARATEALDDPRLAPYAERFIRTVMELSRAAQHALLAAPNASSADKPDGADLSLSPATGTIGFQGVPGSFSEQALLELFGEDRQRAAYTEFSDLFAAVQLGEVSCGVLPIENSSTGAISQVYDLLGQYGFYIVGEHRLRIRQNLAALPGAALDDIRTVYSHLQGIEQSSAFLAQHRGWETVHFHNTAASAQMVAQSGDLSRAAICSERAAALYGLSILAPDIQDNSRNTTRFIVVSRAPYHGQADKASIAFSLRHETGSLYSLLRYFSDRKLNLAKLESRPLPDRPWHYRFYLDFEGDPSCPETRALLETLSQETLEFQFFGGYPSGKEK